MLDALETFHEGTEDIEQSKGNTLIQQYELFHMEDGETISSKQMRFTHIVKKLKNIGKNISNQDCTNKVLRCIVREWQPKVTAIKESQNLNNIGISTLFGKLIEHEHEILKLKAIEEDINKRENNSIVLKDSSSVASSSFQEESNSYEDSLNEEEMRLFIRRHNHYIEINGLKHSDKKWINFRKASFKVKESKKYEKVVYCYGYRKIGHYKSECPKLAKVKGKSNSSWRLRWRGAYISWEDDDMTFILTEFENDEVAHLCFMGHMKKQNEVIYSDSESNPSFEELQQDLVDMYGDAMKDFEKLIFQKKDILKLEVELSQLKNDSECLKDGHASLINEKIVMSYIESPKQNPP